MDNYVLVPKRDDCEEMIRCTQFNKSYYRFRIIFPAFVEILLNGDDVLISEDYDLILDMQMRERYE